MNVQMEIELFFSSVWVNSPLQKNLFVCIDKNYFVSVSAIQIQLTEL